MNKRILLLLLVASRLSAAVYQYTIPSVAETIRARVWVTDWIPTEVPDPDFEETGRRHMELVPHTYIDVRDVTLTSPPATLEIVTDTQGIRNVVLHGSYWQPMIMGYLHRLLYDKEFLLPLDTDNGATFTPELALSFAPAILRAVPPLINAVVKRNGRWVVVGVGAAQAVTRQEAQHLIDCYLLNVALILTLTRVNPDEAFSAIAYQKKHKWLPRIYNGMAAGWGTPQQVMTRRDREHLVEGREDYLPGDIAASTMTKGISLATIWAARGQEQNLINHGWANDFSPDNKIRSVALDNELGYSYYLTALDAYVYIWHYDGVVPIGKSAWPPVNFLNKFSRPPLRP